MARSDNKLRIGKNSINQLLLNPLFRHLFTLIFTILWIGSAFSQNPITGKKSGAKPPDSLKVEGVTVVEPPDSAKTAIPDSNIVITGDSVKVAAKEPALKTKVTYHAKDSLRFDVQGKKVYLYNEAEIKYDDITLTANYIEIDWSTNTLFAKGLPDSTGKIAGTPQFSEKEQSFRADSMWYNFDTKKGRIVKVITTQGEGNIHGGIVKKIDETSYYIRDGGYTTCIDDHPHFLIKSNKLKVIQNDKIVTGPAYLTFEEVPTPLVLPFGFFPNKQGQSSGIIIPEYGESPGLGFFLKNGGYFFSINDNINLALRGDIYSRGSWGARANSMYKRRYKYSGSIELDHNRVRQGDPDFPDFSEQRNYFVRWSHQQDPKARPNTTFSANVNAGSRNNYRNNLNSTTQEFLTNTFQSNIAFSQNIAGTPLSYSINGSHSQNTLNKTVDITLPEFTLNMTRIYPFKKKNTVGKQNVFEKIGISSTLNARNTLSTSDELLFKPVTYEHLDEKMRNGARLNATANTSFKVLKYFTVTPSITGSSQLHTKTLRKVWNADSLAYYNDTIQEFKVTGEWSANASMSTVLYGMLAFKKGGLKAIRHVFTPSWGFTYRPDFGTQQFGYYGTNNTLSSYSIYDLSIYGRPSSGEQGSFNLNLGNNLEMKVKSARDSITGTKKIKILDYFGASASYNFFADSLNLSDIALSARTTLFNKLNINYTGTLTPHVLDSNNRKLNEFRANYDGKVGTITSSTVALGFNLNSQGQQVPTQPNPNTAPQTTPNTEDQLEEIQNNPQAYIDFNIPWNFFMNYNLTYNGLVEENKITQSLTFNGDISLTQKWKIGFTSGYDFVAKDLTQTTLNIYRDLHCWEASFRWVPFGQLRSYSININVKAPILQSLKLTRKRDWYDY